MKAKGPLILLGTAAGLAGILTYRTPVSRAAARSQPTAEQSPGSSGAATPPTTSTGSSGSSGTASGTGSPPSTSVAAVQTATGPTVQYGYGQLAVRVTMSNGRITDVSVPSLQVAESTSQYIAQQAIPMLKRQAISAQSANIQGVSGATYTSQAYAQSLQAALGKTKQG